MDSQIQITNKTMEISDCHFAWFFDSQHDCWCLEDILYTSKATTPKFQRLSIYVPAEYFHQNGEINPDGKKGKYTAKTAPIIFENNAAGYMQMPHKWLGGPRDQSAQYLKSGMIYVTCGCRGRESRNADDELCGKSPITLIDFKTAIRFLRHNAKALPGDMARIISVGTSAGGAMSSLLGLTGDNEVYNPYLEENGAFMEEADSVYASQIYCPIIDLEYADLAYEWQFQNDPENEASHAGPAGTMSAFQSALSQKLAKMYVQYFNELELKDPVTSELLTLNENGRSGNGYNYLMRLLEESATIYLTRLQKGKLSQKYSVDDYITGNYTRKIPAPPSSKKENLDIHHVGNAIDFKTDESKPSKRPQTIGDLLSRPEKGAEYHGFEPQMIDVLGDRKTDWLEWNGTHAYIKDLDRYLLQHRRRMKPCPAFDVLNMDSGENQVFGTPKEDFRHFSVCVAKAISQLKEQFPEEYEQYYGSYSSAQDNPDLNEALFLLNPMNFISTEQSSGTQFFRIRVGACDADTAFTISMALALKLVEIGKNVDYSLVWDLPHCDADYPNELIDWIEEICD